MPNLTIDELHTIMRESAGDWIPVEGGRDIADTTYPELGYDSLALLEILTRIERSVGTSLPEDAVLNTATPGATLAAVNALLANTAVV